MTKFKLLLGVIGLLFASCVLYVFHVISLEVLIGAILCATCAIYILGDMLAIEKGYDEKIKLVFIASVFSLFTMLGLWFLYDDVKEVSLLHFYGKQSVGTVLESKEEIRHRRKGRVSHEYSHVISYDSFKKRLTLDKEYPIGTQFHICYLPDSPQVARMMRPGEHLVESLLNRNSLAGVLLLFLFGPVSFIRWKEFFYVSGFVSRQ